VSEHFKVNGTVNEISAISIFWSWDARSVPSTLTIPSLW
jgi:hypothetical protein